jgi:hypothetical protein
MLNKRGDKMKDAAEAVTKLPNREPEDEDFHSGKIYCANCINCKLILAKPDKGTQYLLRIRCAAGKWKKKLGQEKLYKYCTITRRYLDYCDAYEDMGETQEYIRELRKNISNRDILFAGEMEEGA